MPRSCDKAQPLATWHCSRLPLVLVVAALAAACHPSRPWVSVASTVAVPQDSRVYDQRFSAAADSAVQALHAARIRLNAPALSAAVSIDGSLVWAGVVGWSDVQSGTAATVETEFRIGSTSKAITATALARLVDTRRLALDRPISEYLATLPNRAWSPITLRQLASHTAGIVDYTLNRDLWGLWQSIRETRHFESAREALAVFDDSRLVARPGDRFLYTSYDVNLIGAVIESATGRPFPAALDSLVLFPLQVRGMYAQHTADSSRQAVFYESRAQRWRRWRRVDHSYKWPSGGLVATPSAVATVGSAWFDTTFISAQTREAFWTPQRLSSGALNEQSYALGWRVQSSSALWGSGERVSVVHHGGVSKGSFSWLIIYPQYRLVVALAMNARADSFRSFMTEEPPISRLFLHTLDAPAARRQ